MSPAPVADELPSGADNTTPAMRLGLGRRRCFPQISTTDLDEIPSRTKHCQEFALSIH